MTFTGAQGWREAWENIPAESWERWEAYQAWKRTWRGRLALRLYPFWHRAYLYLARKDGWA